MNRSVKLVKQEAPKTGSLSDRFAKITQDARQPNAPGKRQRMAAQTAQINIRRGSKIAEKRFGKVGTAASSSSSAAARGRGGAANNRGGRGRGGVVAGRGGGGQRGGFRGGVKNVKNANAGRGNANVRGRGAAKGNKPAGRGRGAAGQQPQQRKKGAKGKGLFNGPQPTNEELDFEMDKYMHSGK